LHEVKAYVRMLPTFLDYLKKNPKSMI
jgi:hypothetical protein